MSDDDELTNKLPVLPPEQIRAMFKGAALPLAVQIAVMPPEQIRELARDQAQRLQEQEATIAELRKGVEQANATIDGMRRERERLEAELLALRRLRGDMPRTVGDLIAWRAARGVTQAAAAKLLGVGRATIERAEAQDFDSPLGPALRRAFELDAKALREAEDSAKHARALVGAAKGSGRARGARSAR
jgi:DNA-binding XRE family transcriptional regulator